MVGEMHLSAVGEIAAQYWREIPEHHADVELDEFVVMPNHVHGIVMMRKPVETPHATSLQGDPKMSEISPKVESLSTIIRSYKSAVTRFTGLNGLNGFAWQSRFYDHIIRDEKSFNIIRQYIFDNPLKWELDKENLSNLYM